MSSQAENTNARPGAETVAPEVRQVAAASGTSNGTTNMNNSTAKNDTANAQSAQPTYAEEIAAVEVVLGNTREATKGAWAALSLHKQLSLDVKSLRHAQGPSLGPPSEDKVLLYCLAACAGSDTDDLLDQAQRQYQKQPDDYDLVLEGFLPEDFQQQARAQLLQQAYHENANVTAAEDWPVFLSMRRSMGDGTLSGPPTGLPKLDAMLGGLRGLMFLGADKGVGKTSLALYSSLAALRARKDLAVLLYSLDMSKTRIYERLLCCESGLDHRTLFSGAALSKENREIAKAANVRLQSEVLPRIQVVERDFSYQDMHAYAENAKPVRKGLTCGSILRDCRQLMQASETDEVLVILDLFQKMDPRGEIADGAAKDHYRLDVLDQLRKQSCRGYAPHGFPILVTSEIRKAARDEGLSFDDLKGDGRMASDADVVMLMWPESAAGETSGRLIPTILRIDKGREGVIRGDLRLWFQHACCRFFDTAPAVADQHFATTSKMASSPHRTRPALDPLAE